MFYRVKRKIVFYNNGKNFSLKSKKKNLMRLVILTQYFSPEMGAASARLFEMARGFSKRGWKLKIITAMPNYPTGNIFSEYKGKFSVKEKFLGLDIQRFWIYASNSNRTLPRIINMITFAFTAMFSYFELRKFKPDFVLVSSPPLALGFTGYILSKLLRAKFILNVADLWPLSALQLEAISNGTVYKSLEKFEQFIYKKADLCLGQSEEIVSHLNQKGTKKALLFRNGVDLYRFNNGKNAPANGQLKIVYAGLIGVAQGLLKLCQNIDPSAYDAQLHIYGDGADKKELNEYLKNNPDKNIHLHESINRDEVPALLTHYDAALIPLYRNIYGAVPSKIYEAMAAGLPILFSGNGEGASIIDRYEVGWVTKPGDYEAINKALCELISNMHKTKYFAENGKKYAKEVFDREIQIDRLHNYLLNYEE